MRSVDLLLGALLRSDAEIRPTGADPVPERPRLSAECFREQLT
jgi:hypothetical protein